MINDIDGAGYDFRACGHAVPCKCGEAMTNPPPPPASAMGLVAKFRAFANDSRCTMKEQRAFAKCAADLAAALSLSEEEREAVRDARQAVRFGDPVTDYTAGLLLALITRTYGETP